MSGALPHENGVVSDKWCSIIRTIEMLSAVHAAVFPPLPMLSLYAQGNLFWIFFFYLFWFWFFFVPTSSPCLIAVPLAMYREILSESFELKPNLDCNLGPLYLTSNRSPFGAKSIEVVKLLYKFGLYEQYLENIFLCASLSDF